MRSNEITLHEVEHQQRQRQSAELVALLDARCMPVSSFIAAER